MNKEEIEDKILYFKCPKCKKIIERHSSNPFLGFLKLYCDSFCEQKGAKVRMWRYLKLWKKKK